MSARLYRIPFAEQYPLGNKDGESRSSPRVAPAIDLKNLWMFPMPTTASHPPSWRSWKCLWMESLPCRLWAWQPMRLSQTFSSTHVEEYTHAHKLEFLRTISLCSVAQKIWRCATQLENLRSPRHQRPRIHCTQRCRRCPCQENLAEIRDRTRT